MWFGNACPPPLNRLQSSILPVASPPAPAPGPSPSPSPAPQYANDLGEKNFAVSYYHNPAWGSTATISAYSKFAGVTNGYYNDSVTMALVASTVSGVATLSNKTDVLPYRMRYEIQRAGSSKLPAHPSWRAMQKMVIDRNYWLRKLDGTAAAWNGTFEADNIRLTGGANETPDSNGEGVSAALARLWWNGGPVNTGAAWVGASASGVKGLFHDNSWPQNQGDETKGTVDFLKDGVGRKSTDAVVINAFAAESKIALAAEEARAGRTLKQYGNMLSKTDMSHPDITGRFDGALLEDAMGHSYSEDLAANRQWPWVITRLRTASANMRGRKLAILGMRLFRERELQIIRYGICASKLQDNSACAVYDAVADTSLGLWDEWMQPRGNRVGAVPNAATQDGIWSLEWEGQLVLVNPGNNKGKAFQSYNSAHYIRRTSGVVRMFGPAHGLTNGEQFWTAGFQSGVKLNGGPWTAQVASATDVSWVSAGADGAQAADAGCYVFGYFCKPSTINVGAGWREFGPQDPLVTEGSPQDPVYNSGKVVTSVTMLSANGKVLVRV